MSDRPASQNPEQRALENVTVGGSLTTGDIHQTQNITTIFQGKPPFQPETVLEWLRQSFERAKNSWLSNRYSPDLHQTGQIEADLQLRLNDLSLQQEWLEEVRQIRVLLEDVHLAVLRLRRYSQFMQRDDAENLIRSAEEWMVAAIAEQQELEKRLLPGNSFPLPDFEQEVTDKTAPWQLISIIYPDKKGTSELATADVGKQLEATLNRWLARKVTPRYLRTLGQPAAYVGEPGVGKTHALANAVRDQLAVGKPAILIRAKEVDLAKSWDVILAEAIGLPGANINQVLDALEATTTQVETSNISDGLNDSQFQSIRALIAIDGLDETFKAERWAEKLGELIPLAEQYPKVLFVCSLRTNLFYRITLPGGINSVHLSGSDATLDEIFESYCKVNRIECPPILRWALQTPLAIRLFADLYQGQHIHTVTLQEFSLVSLINRKIDYAERAIRENDPEGWSENITPVRDTLRAIVKACLSQAELLQAEALQVIDNAQRTPGILSRQQLANILDKCLDHGLLLLRRQPSDDPFEGDLLFWEPAYETVTDFLLAWEACNEAATNLSNPEMPAYLWYRDNAITLAAYLLGMKGHDFFTTGLWSNSLSLEEREELRLTIILMMPPEKGEDYRTWVIEIFKKNMPSCRKVLDRLVIPGLRIPGYLYGGQFVHDVLLPMQVAERDLFWSGPDYIPRNHGAPWEDFGEPVLDDLKIADDDTWNTAPLLLAWGTTTVKNNSRRKMRGKLAVWGSQNPDGLFALLKQACQTNDPQMKEDILSVAYGASCLTQPDERWLRLCNWIIDNFYTSHSPLYSHNILIRHSAQSVVERCFACNVAIDATRLANIRIPVTDAEELLPIDRQAAIDASEYWRIGLLNWDLEHYFLSGAIRPFFDEYRFARVQQNSNQSDEDEDREEFEDIDENLLRQFAEGSLRKSADHDARNYVCEIVREKAEQQAMVETFRSPTEEEIKKLSIEWGIPDQETEKEVEQEVLPEAQQELEYSKPAQDLLSRHAAANNLSNLKPNQFAVGFITAYATKLGWSREIFIKEPKGEEPGEILGADIAVLRQYSQATHGSRSSTGTFGEKYVWAATNELLGFLASHIPAYDWKNHFEPPVDLSLFAKMKNLASDIGYGQLTLNQVLEFPELVHDAELSAFDQVDRANEWVQKAPLPDIQPLLLQHSDQLPDWARNDEWLVLRSFVIRRNSDSQAESVLRASSFLFPSNTLPLIEEDARFGVLPDLYHPYEFSSGVASVEVYRDPCEVVWAPWIREIEGVVSHKTLDELGNPLEIELQATTCQFHWETPDGEHEEWVPAQTLRELLGIVDFRGGKFLTASGQVQASTFDNPGERWHTPSCQILLVRRLPILEALARQNLSIGWGIWLYREPAYPLNVIAGKKRIFRNCYALVFWSNDTFKVIPYKNQTEPWYKDESMISESQD
ncbi:hypothetical protein [Gloeocapsopsis dulcis]|uniref:Uncharacterized protein n=1 Tax=Gloeocapsopsis dulcis AAB1 = 1H9 TaxID=1433147 RepID=A0A6N8G013_9CHRO|nr:hypothetical protein [Gloeocapsopsis dulcis]MUL37915.1 hypothetical protein [Gloeocapsopsis dulcis AAB1 = 1H9]WNN87310.1 hypothetical protein P0S91_13275 [Gloeocapsopsis dulcis]